MTTIKIGTGKYRGRYEIDANGKIQHVLWNSRGEVRNTVGRGTARHKAVLEAIDKEAGA